MHEHSCARAGAEGCGFTTRANSDDELRQTVTEHARKKHNVKVMTDTIYNYIVSVAKK